MTSTTRENRPMLSLREVATLCALSERTIRRSIERGELPAHKLGGSVRIAASDIEAWLASSRITPCTAWSERTDPGTFRTRMTERGRR